MRFWSRGVGRRVGTGRLRLLGIVLVALVGVGGWVAGPWSDRGGDRGGRGDAPPRQLAVSPSGSDSGDGSAEQPFKTLSHALAVLRPGDSLSVHGGTYVENVRPQIAAGRPDAPIRVSAAPGERPVLRGLLWLHDPSYWSIDGLNVEWKDGNGGTSHMVTFEGGTGWSLTGSELSGSRSYSALLVAADPDGQPPRDWTIAGNCIHDTAGTHSDNQDHLIYVNTGLARTTGLIERNLLFNAENGNGVKLGGTTENEPVRDVTVRYNTINRTSQSVMVTGTSTEVVIDHNLMTGATLSGRTHLRGYIDHGAQVQVSNNVFYDQNLFIWSDTGSIIAGDGNVERNPRYLSEGCDGFRPADPVAATAGRYAEP